MARRRSRRAWPPRITVAKRGMWLVNIDEKALEMNFVESRLLGIQIDETGREVVMSLIEASGARFALQLHGVERLLINEVRQQNIVEDLTHWKRGAPSVALRQAAFALMAGVPEKDCGVELVAVARSVMDRVVRGELEMIEISAVFGAQALASLRSMTVRTGLETPGAQSIA